MPVLVECPGCSERGCERCNGVGSFELNGCPCAFVGDEIWQAIDLADDYEKGLPPVAGGTLDQSPWINALRRRVVNERERVKLELTPHGR